MSYMIVGDPHLNAGSVISKQSLGGQLSSRALDQFNLLNWILDQAIDNNVSTLFFTGDMFDDPKPPSSVVVLLIEWLKKCSDANISVHMLLGNHDLLRSGQYQFSSLDIITAAEIENVFVHKTITTINMSDASFTLIPFRDRRFFNVSSHDEAIEILQNKIAYEVADVNLHNLKIMIGHLAIAGSIPALNEIDDTINELFCPISTFKDYNYTFFGHIHKFQELNQNPLIAHIGSLDISNFGEVNQEKFVVIIDPKKQEKHRYIKIPTRSLKQVSISVPEDVSDATSFILKELENNKINLAKSIVKVNVSLNNSDSVKIDRSKIEKYLNDEVGVFHTAGLSEERRVSSIKKNTLDNGIDNTVNEIKAIKMYAEINIEETIREEFIEIANSIVSESK